MVGMLLEIIGMLLEMVGAPPVAVAARGWRLNLFFRSSDILCSSALNLENRSKTRAREIPDNYVFFQGHQRYSCIVNL